MAMISSAVTFSLFMDLLGEAGEEFFGSDGGCANFANDNSSGVIGKNSGFERRCAAGDGESKSSNDRVARARDVENFLSDCGNVMRCFTALTKQHSEFAQSNEQQGRAKFVEEAFRGTHQIRVGQRINIPR